MNTGVIFTPEAYILCENVWESRWPGNREF